MIPYQYALRRRMMQSINSGLKLGHIEVGSIVYINENSSPVEFYVAKHNYESELNGTGRTLLVRKDCYDSQIWDGWGNDYAYSSIDSWLNSTYKALLDADIQSVIGTTQFYYTPGSGYTNVTPLTRAIFLLSVTELGKSATYANTEGSALPIASTLQIAYRNGSAEVQWTRSPHTNNTSHVCCLNTKGNTSNLPRIYSRPPRPAFTLPANIKVNKNTMLIA